MAIAALGNVEGIIWSSRSVHNFFLELWKKFTVSFYFILVATTTTTTTTTTAPDPPHSTETPGKGHGHVKERNCHPQ